MAASDGRPSTAATRVDDAQLRRIEALQALLSGAGETTDTGARIDALIADAPAAELADAIESLPAEDRLRLWARIRDAGVRGAILVEAHGEVRRDLIEASADAELIEAFAEIDLDELSDVVDDLPQPVIDGVLARMPQARRARFELLRRYPHDSAGGLMDVDAITMRPEMTIAQVHAALARHRAERGNLPSHLDALMIVDQDSCYRGQVLLTDLVSLDAQLTMQELSTTKRAAVPAEMPATRVARLFEDQDLVSAPVLDADNRVLGRITVDDVVDVLRGEAERSVMAQSGLSEDDDTFAPAWRAARKRALWLGINLGTALFAAWVIGRFDAAIDQIVALAVLMPVVASMGGVAGAQSLAVVIRGLALEQVHAGNRMRLIRKEVVVGVLNGVLWATALALVAAWWFGRPALAGVAATAIVLNLLLGVTFGTMIPMTLQRLNIDPALAGSVVLVAATDALGFFIFLGLATLILL